MLLPACSTRLSRLVHGVRVQLRRLTSHGSCGHRCRRDDQMDGAEDSDYDDHHDLDLDHDREPEHAVVMVNRRSLRSSTSSGDGKAAGAGSLPPADLMGAVGQSQPLSQSPSPSNGGGSSSSRHARRNQSENRKKRQPPSDYGNDNAVDFVGHDDDDDADHAPSRPVSLSPTSLSFSGSLEDSWKIRREFRCFSDAGADGDAGPQWVAESLFLSSSSSSSSWLGPLSSDPSKSRGGSGGQSQALLLDKCRSFVGFVHGAGSRNVRPIPRTARARCAFPAFECSERRSEERWPLQMCVRRAIVSS